MKAKLKIVDVSKKIETLNARHALGYESTLDFNHGFITALKINKLISVKDANALIKVYASVENGDCRYTILNTGELHDYEKD
jgi:hypothetical protein